MMKICWKTWLLLCAAAAVVCAGAGPAFAIGELSVGINMGATYDPNNLEGDIAEYNMAMEQYRNANDGTTAKQMSVPYAPVFGFNFRYQFNFFLIRMGCHYTSPVQSIKGSITPPGGVKNTIKIKTYQNSYPVTLGLLVPLNKKTNFFIGAGPTLHQASVTITQSEPVQGAFSFQNYGLSKDRRDSYTATFVGYHIMLGAEVPVHERFTMSVEWIHQEGRSHTIKNDGLDSTGAVITTPKHTISVQGDFLIFGLNYYISL